MKTKTILWLLIATVLILVGGILFTVALHKSDWNFKNLSTVSYETNEHPVWTKFENITIVTNTADIELVYGERASVTCYEQNNAHHTVTVKDGTLRIEINDETEWYEHIGINLGSPKITVCLPKGHYGNLDIIGSTGSVTVSAAFDFVAMDIALSTGDIRLQNIFVQELRLSVSTGRITVNHVECLGNLDIHVSTGKCELTNVTCQNLKSDGNTGDISLNTVMVAENIQIERSTGDVSFDRCDAAQMTILTDTGDVSGTLLSPKIFLCETDTGRVDVPKTTTGGICRITTDTGDIHIEIQT